MTPEEIERLLGKLPAPPAPAPVAAPTPEPEVMGPPPPLDIDKLLSRLPGVSVAPPQVPEASPTPAPEMGQEEMERLLGKLPKPGEAFVPPPAAPPPAPDELSALDLFAGSFRRMGHSIASAPEAYKAQVLSAAGRQEEADAIMARLQREEKAAGILDQKESLERTWNEPSRIGRYLAERTGEFAPQIIAGVATGGAGYLAGALGTRLGAAVLPRLVTWSAPTVGRFMATAGVGAGSTLVETADTAEDLYKRTGTTQGTAALAAGAIKGGMEVLPMGSGKLLQLAMRPKEALGEVAKKGFTRQVAGTMAGESAQEMGQAVTDIATRAIVTAGTARPYDPLGKEAVLEVVEGGLLGGFFGGLMAAPTVATQIARTPEEEIEGFRKKYVPPVTDLNNAVKTIPELGTFVPKELDKTLPDVTSPMKPSVDDPLNMSGQLKSLQDEIGPGSAAFKEVLESNTDRYALVHGDGRALMTLYTDTELEQKLASEPQTTSLQVVKVDQGALDQRMITADVFDLSPVNSNKVWFLPEVPQEARQGLLEEYSRIQPVSETVVKEGALVREFGVEAVSRRELEKAYHPLLKAGLRVIPSYGRSFWYAAKFGGQRVAGTPGTGRTKQVGIFNPKTGAIELNRGRLQQSEFLRSGIPVALDLRRMKPGTVSGIPTAQVTGFSKLDGWRFAEGVTEKKKKELFAKLDATGKINPSAQEMREVMQEGMWYEPTKGSEGLVMLNKADIRNFTYGVRRDRARVRSRDMESSAHVAMTSVKLQAGKSVVVERMDTVAPHDLAMYRKMVVEAKKYLPKIDKLMRAMGMPGGVEVRISEELGFSAALPTDGVIILSPHEFQRAVDTSSGTTGSFALDFSSTMLHELGHLVTLNLFSKVPVQDKMAVKQAYNRALLADRMQVETIRQSRTISEYEGLTGGVSNTRYYQGFSEWLAEQFRRYVRTNPEMRHEFELPFPEVTAGLKEFYNKWNKLVGPLGELNLRSTDHYFGEWLERVRSWNEKIAPLRALEEAQQTWRLADGITWSPGLQQVMQTVVHAVDSLKQMDIGDVPLILAGEADPRIGPLAGTVSRVVKGPTPAQMRGTPYWSKTANPIALIELAVGALPTKVSLAEARDVVASAWTHAYIELGLMSPAEVTLLARGAPSMGIKLDSATLGIIRQKGEELRQRHNGTQQDVDNFVKALSERLLAVEVVGRYAQRGDAPAGIRGILELVLATLRRIREYLSGTGYDLREQLVRDIFNGQIASRYNPPVIAPVPTPQAGGVMHGPVNPARDFDPRGVVQVDQELHTYIGEVGGTGANAKELIYYFYKGLPAEQMHLKPEADYVGYVHLKNRTGLGFEVGMVEVVKKFRRQGYATRFHEFWQRDLGYEHQPSGELTQNGYSYWSNKNPEMVKYHVKDSNMEHGTGHWLSPRKVDQLIAVFEQGLRMNPQMSELSRKGWEAKIAYYKRLRAKIDKRAWGDPALKTAFSRPQAAFDGVQASMVRSGLETEGQAAIDALEGLEGSTTDAFDSLVQQDLQFSQMENAETLGVPFEEAAPQTFASRPIRNMIERVQGLGLSKQEQQTLKQLPPNIDRIGHFSKHWWGLQQLAWVNEHISGLQNYVQHTNQMSQRVTAWMTRADETARAWEKLGEPGQVRVGEYLFWLAEMQYRTPTEVAQGVVRQPTQAEEQREMQRRRLGAGEVTIVQRVKGDFAQFLADVERVSAQNLQRTISDPVVLQKALADLAKQMGAMRSKPYFPFVRFGPHTIAVRDPSQNNKVVWFSAYDTAIERTRALPRVAAQHPGMDITYGRVPEEAQQFMGLPPPLISHILATMPGLSVTQRTWMEEFAAAHLPGNSFRRRWLKKEGTPGYNTLEGFRAYAHYFMSGSKFLARMEYDHALQQDIRDVEASKGNIQNSEKRQLIVDYMNKHYRYITENARDFSKFRALVALWQLGFSVTAAGMNLTQIPHVLSPFLRATFGTLHTGTLTKLFKVFRRGATTRGLGPAGEKARLEMIDQGRIHIGQASELGAFAEGHNLVKLMAGTRGQKAYRQLSWAGMLMFSKVEQFNRELSFRAAWDLAMKYPNTRRLQEIGLNQVVEIGELIGRLGLTHQEAVAFLYAREAIDKTQGNYAPWAKPAFMRDRWVGAATIFLQYLQMMIYAFRWNGATVQMLLIGLLFYGLQGFMPGSEDAEEVLKLVGWKLFGKDWSLKEKAREYLVGLTKGTVFDKIGPDLAMHGISRYGFGVGMIPEGFYAPRFDVSANGSMAKVIPGFSEAMRKLTWKSDWEGAVAAAAQGVGGAGMGPMFALMQMMAEPPGTTDSKRWESAVPRVMRDGAKAWRYAQEGETTRQGGRVVRFDVRDPDDLATVIAQALGARPRKVSQFWERERAFADSSEVFAARRLAIYGQYDEAIRSGDKAAIAGMNEVVKRFNADVIASGDASQAITMSMLQSSLKGRAAIRARQEEGIPLRKGDYSTYKRIEDLYPELVQERRPVR